MIFIDYVEDYADYKDFSVFSKELKNRFGIEIDSGEDNLMMSNIYKIKFNEEEAENLARFIANNIIDGSITLQFYKLDNPKEGVFIFVIEREQYDYYEWTCDFMKYDTVYLNKY